MPAAKVVVNLQGAPSYDVRIGEGILAALGERVVRCAPGASAALLISDSNVGPLYAKVAHDSLKAAGLRVVDITIPAGESSKSLACVSEIWSAMAAQKKGRDCCVVALGGGVVGDIAGFVAATYMRGVPLVQVPTSLLAMVDSSVGGKTGINLEAGKNLVGAFKQPVYVCASTDTLASLPEREWVSGCGEIAKCSVLESDSFFFWLVEHADELATREPSVVQEAITRSVVFKANVVSTDVDDTAGKRACLNYGHTFAHALEQVAGYGTYSHGHAVAQGMRFAVRLGAALVGTPIELVEEQDALLDALGLPMLDLDVSPEALLGAMRLDKKNAAGAIHFILPEDVGKWSLQAVDEETILEHLAAMLQHK